MANLSSPSTLAQPQSRFLTLPPEIRAKIFSEYFKDATMCFGDDEPLGLVPINSESNQLLPTCRLIYEEARPIQAALVSLYLEWPDCLRRFSLYKDHHYLSRIQQLSIYSRILLPDPPGLQLHRLPSLKVVTIENSVDMSGKWKTWEEFDAPSADEALIQSVKDELEDQCAFLNRHADDTWTQTELLQDLLRRPDIETRFISPHSWWPHREPGNAGLNEDELEFMKFVAIIRLNDWTVREKWAEIIPWKDFSVNCLCCHHHRRSSSSRDASDRHDHQQDDEITTHDHHDHHRSNSPSKKERKKKKKSQKKKKRRLTKRFKSHLRRLIWKIGRIMNI